MENFNEFFVSEKQQDLQDLIGSCSKNFILVKHNFDSRILFQVVQKLEKEFPTFFIDVESRTEENCTYPLQKIFTINTLEDLDRIREYLKNRTEA